MNDSDAENKLSRLTNTNTLHPGNLQKNNNKRTPFFWMNVLTVSALHCTEKLLETELVK